MLDFTIDSYSRLLKELQNVEYSFLTLEQYCEMDILPERFILLRHDVDRKSRNALKMAEAENDLGIQASYYFRIVKESNNPDIIKRIIELGHEIGYHYEDLSTAKGDYEKAYSSFTKNLEYFRTFYPVKTMCMHGSPLSKWDNKLLWEKYNYKEFGILGEPYFDLDFNEVFYITDASRSWNNEKVTLRDKVKSQFQIKVESIFDLETILKSNNLPDKVMLSTHPHNWATNNYEWYKILFWQGFKNVLKRRLVR